MQERYLGDSHDFIKFALLRHLHKKCKVRIGVNWHFTRPEDVDRAGGKDGEKRHHLKDGAWERLDSGLLKIIKDFETPENRRLENIKSFGILPKKTLYFNEPAPADIGERSLWSKRARAALKKTDLIFLDPDNGLEVKSMTRKRSPKYALYSEAADYLNSSQITVVIQFAGRGCSVEKQVKKIREKLKKLPGKPSVLPVVRGRVAPNILFFTLAPSGRAKGVGAALKSFAVCGPEVRGRRIIEIIK